MRLLLHSCCAPCTIYPLEKLLGASTSYTGIGVLFYNPNIHPYTEYRNRLNSLKAYLEEQQIDLHVPEEYELKTFFRSVAHNEASRCTLCYTMRLDYLFAFARLHGYEAISTTLLYSKHQNHAFLRDYCQENAKRHSLHFHYEDFREGWLAGQEKSVDKKMYRQKYCGCIYSEQERYDNRLKKKLQKAKKAAQKKLDIK